MTRLLLTVNILNSKTKMILSSSVAWARAKKLKDELEKSYQAQSGLREKLNVSHRRAGNTRKALEKEMTENAALSE